jgi:hypothetical protein
MCGTTSLLVRMCVRGRRTHAIAAPVNAVASTDVGQRAGRPGLSAPGRTPELRLKCRTRHSRRVPRDRCRPRTLAGRARPRDNGLCRIALDALSTLYPDARQACNCGVGRTCYINERSDRLVTVRWAATWPGGSYGVGAVMNGACRVRAARAVRETRGGPAATTSGAAPRPTSAPSRGPRWLDRRTPPTACRRRQGSRTYVMLRPKW